MGVYEIALTVTAFAALIAWIVFGLSYDRVKWYMTGEGRNVMTLTVSLILLIGVIAFNRFIPWIEVKYVLVAISLLAIAITGVWRTYQLKAAQKAHKARTEASKAVEENK